MNPARDLEYPFLLDPDEIRDDAPSDIPKEHSLDKDEAEDDAVDQLDRSKKD